jgi:hypothetical protein
METKTFGEAIGGDDKKAEFIDYFAYLYSRWQDEKAYEDWAEYGKELERRFGVTVVRFTHRPWEGYMIVGGEQKYAKIKRGDITFGSWEKGRA